MPPRLSVITSLDPGEIAVAATAVREVVNTLTYWGQSVGSYVTDEQCTALATAVVTAIENYKATQGAGK